MFRSDTAEKRASSDELPIQAGMLGVIVKRYRGSSRKIKNCNAERVLRCLPLAQSACVAALIDIPAVYAKKPPGKRARKEIAEHHKGGHRAIALEFINETLDRRGRK